MHVRLLAIGTLTSMALSSAHVAFAQPTEAAVEAPSTLPGEESISLRTGDTLEIAAETGINGATYSWIMTQDRSFIDAKREKFFRYRFVNDNVYTLRAEAILPDTGERIQRTFHITVMPPDAPQQTPLVAAGTGASIASTIPPPDANGRVVLKPGDSLVQLIPISADISPLALDFDASFDSDADGNPGNDVDNVNEDNGFHSFGKPLWIWYARPIQSTDITVTAVPEGQSPQVQRISVLSEEAARQQGVLTSPLTILVTPSDGATYSFSATFANQSASENPLLYEWNFGDGNLSLETEPVHTYASSGTFNVTLSVRDLQTGNSIGSTATSISATVADTPAVDEPTEPVIDEPSEPTVDEPTEPAVERSAIDWSRIGIFVGIFLGALILGFAIIWLLSFLRKSRKLEETLESIESVVAPEKELAPPPLAIKGKQQAAQQKIIDAEISASSSPKEPPASVHEEKAPDWLKKGLANDASKPATPPATKPTTPPGGQSATAASSTAPANPQEKNLPRWLQNPAPAPTSPSPSNPTPLQASAPKPSVTTAPPAVPPAPVPPTPKPASTTPAAQPAAAPSSAAPPPSPKPVPPAPKPTPMPPPPPAAPTARPAAAVATQPTAPAVRVPPPPVPPAPKPVPQAPKPFVPSAPTIPAVTPAPKAPAPPTPTPTAVTPPPIAPIAPAPLVQIPPPTQAPPLNAPNNKNDDDPPIAIIRAESIDPGPKK